MGYIQQTWAELDPTTPLSPDRLNHLEQGLYDVAAAVDSLPSSTSIAEAVAAETSRAEAAEALLTGSWTAYTPVLSGTGWAIGNGTLSGAYERISKTVRFKIIYTAGSTSTYSATITPSLSLPVTAANADPAQFGAEIVSGASVYLLHGRKATTTTATVHVVGTNGLHAPLTSASTPAAASGTVVTISGEYQAA